MNYNGLIPRVRYVGSHLGAAEFGDATRVTPRFPKYGVWGRDNGQQILIKSVISFMNTLSYQ